MDTGYEATADWTASYDRPVALSRGEALVLDGRSDTWDGHRWLWARDPRGREGWVPDDLPVASGTGHVAARDYSAQELTCRIGDALTAVALTHGWAWCRNAAGGEGWVPLRCLRPDP